MTLNQIYNHWLTQVLLISVIGIALGFIIAKTDLVGAGALIALPFVIVYLVLVFKDPRIGLYTVFNLGFFVNGLVRYSTAPFGLSIDIFLLITLIAALFKVKKENSKYLNNPFMYGIVVWTAFTIFEIINPQARSLVAWFYAVRGVSLYMLQLVILTILLLNKPDELIKFMKTWIVWSLIAGVWAMKQLYIGLNHAEQMWMDAGAYKTHLLFGRLRAFSFYSDAGQFGAAMGHILLVCLILSFGPFKLKQKLMLWGLSIFFFWAMAISGTRGANFVPFSGIMVYLFLTKNFKILSIGILVVGVLFGLLKYTSVGSGNYQVQRMRSAFDPNDPSLQVRIENQKKFKAYLENKPLGGGIGSAGSWGQRFSPGTFLAETATDSWYVKIWAETGIIGLFVHLGMIFTYLGTGTILIYKMKNDMMLRQFAMAFLSGFAGCAVASYGNQIMGQAPSGIVLFMGIAFVWLCYQWDKNKIKITVIN
ncbi:O-antigen ligase family protein [Mucilaginibacter sp. FT3.2]|uniref:O-antigen ligase family protein n=1 Tax=Mucilaginibacter sp. FT3.2 TaxID=2723090 RepID=UPI00160CBF6F|nr:O-antigen ligase family protein [Mucilaginibacter sp. FT3.2]MBB6233636.1 hypothetical protein [Mucilaginibacter sp. FT3.2]